MTALVAIGACAGAGFATEALLLAAGGVLFPMSRIPEVPALALVADLLILAALAPVAFSARRGTGAAA